MASVAFHPDEDAPPGVDASMRFSVREGRKRLLGRMSKKMLLRIEGYVEYSNRARVGRVESPIGEVGQRACLAVSWSGRSRKVSSCTADKS